MSWTPNLDEMSQVLHQFDNAPEYSHYHDEKKAIDLAIKTWPKNNNVSQVIIKCALINGFYSTGLKEKDLSSIAHRIVKSQEFQSRFSSGVVCKLTTFTRKAATTNSYSFASKYCNFHYPEDFPIYDSFVFNAIKYLRTNDKNSKLKINKNHENYPDFAEYVKQVRDIHLGKEVKLTDLDHYLWIRGKEIYDAGYCDGISGVPQRIDFVDYRDGYKAGASDMNDKVGQEPKTGEDNRPTKKALFDEGLNANASEWPATNYKAYQIGWKKANGYIAKFLPDGSIYFPTPDKKIKK